MIYARPEIRVISESDLFDPSWYISKYPDVEAARMDPAEHYFYIGAKIGRNPSNEFDTNYYLFQNPDVAEAEINPLYHYITYGKNEGRKPLPSPLLPSKKKDRIDVVIPVFNALENVQDCLNSVLKETDCYKIKIFVVNDGSGEATSSWLASFCKQFEVIELIQHVNNQGYTKAVNSGLLASEAPYVILLNSDTIVTRGWINGLVRCMKSNPRAGITGPLSNAASWQSVPRVKDENGQFSVNKLPNGVKPEKVAELIRKHSKHIYPSVPFINGFCFMIARKVIDTIGVMDEETFPRGYGEEDDYCIRAVMSGFSLHVADDVYVYHAKSKSFGHAVRKELSKKGGIAVRTKHGAKLTCDKIRDAEETSRLLNSLREKLLDDLNSASEDKYKETQASSNESNHLELMPKPAFLDKEYALDHPVDSPIYILNSFSEQNTCKQFKDPLLLGVHLHLFYTKQKTEFLRLLKQIKLPFHLYVSTIDQSQTPFISNYFKENLPEATVDVRCFENRGRDIAAFVVGFGKDLLKHELICHVHTKCSPHNLAKRDWRHQLTKNLLGSPALTRQILSLFETNNHLGMVFPAYHWSLAEQINWGTNYANCESLAKRLGIKVSEKLLPLFPAGSMFWARSKALKKLFKADLRFSDFPKEEGQIDGTLAHAIERMLGSIVREAGYRQLQVCSEKPYNLTDYFTSKWPYNGKKESEIASVVNAYWKKKDKKNRVAVFTAISGNYDCSVAHEVLCPNFDYLLFTDSATDNRGFWQIKSIEERCAKNVLKARLVKANPHYYCKGYDLAVWLDANILIKCDLNKYLDIARANPNIPVFGIPHPLRDCAYAEAEVIKSSGKADRSVVDRQMKKYSEEGYPKKFGLIETGFIIVNLKNPSTEKIMFEWRNEIITKTHRDQLSINYALWKCNASWQPLMNEGLSVRDSGDFAYFGHGRNTGYNPPYIDKSKKVLPSRKYLLG